MSLIFCNAIIKLKFLLISRENFRSEDYLFNIIFYLFVISGLDLPIIKLKADDRKSIALKLNGKDTFGKKTVLHRINSSPLPMLLSILLLLKLLF